MEEKKIEVKIISRENVKPSSPTPSHLKNFTLSLLDQKTLPLHIKSLLVYTTTTQTLPPDIVALLKTSLSQTLCKFYPLAGRCKDLSTITCNDEGVPFFEANVNCPLSAFLSSARKYDLLSKFCPPRDLLGTKEQPLSEIAQLAIQINIFECGGVVIGSYMLHKIMDATSLGLFFRHWAAHALASHGKHNEDITVQQPDFEAIVNAFPPRDMANQVTKTPNPSHQPTQERPVAYKAFVISNNAITELKAKAASERVPKPTRFEVVTGFIWHHVLAAEAAVSSTPLLADSTSIRPSMVIFAIDMRTRANPPLPEGSIGNLATQQVARATKGTGFTELVAEIHAAVLRMNDVIMNQFRGEEGGEAIIAYREELLTDALTSKQNPFLVTSWCRNGLEEVDFGFGCPRYIVPWDGVTMPGPRSSMVFITDTSDDGIAVWIVLDEKEMQSLETNEDFLSFASEW